MISSEIGQPVQGSHTFIVRFPNGDFSEAELHFQVVDNTFTYVRLEHFCADDIFTPRQISDSSVIRDGMHLLNLDSATGEQINLHFVSPLSNTGELNIALVSTDKTLVDGSHRVSVPYSSNLHAEQPPPGPESLLLQESSDAHTVNEVVSPSENHITKIVTTLQLVLEIDPHTSQVTCKNVVVL